MSLRVLFRVPAYPHRVCGLKAAAIDGPQKDKPFDTDNKASKKSPELLMYISFAIRYLQK